MENDSFNQYFQFYLYVYFLALSRDIIFGGEVSPARSIFSVIIGRVFLCASKRFVLVSLSIMNEDFFCIDIEADRPPPEPPPIQEDDIGCIAFFPVAGQTGTISALGSLPVAGKTGKFNNSFLVVGQVEPISNSMSRHNAVRVHIVAGLANMSAFIWRFCSLSHPSVVLNAMIVMIRLLVVIFLVKN
ncbi:unnamed protein product [Cuscuta epithymum]|uniref:Uncharacterized protein n=1 Tax=Cuscuta epithymum TaxID=186058 RepID=A0AAV0FL95_9ASTE|nr:unnamed protein product [Cuscuta epithymum]